ncbi:MAG: hypothetical protein WAL89_17900 [Candidatus Sulfotelmatobacter sp.]
MKLLTEQLVTFAGEIATLRASVSVLKVALACEMNPSHPETALTLFARLQQKFLDADPSEQQRKEVAELMDAMKLWQKHGKHEA